MVWDKAALCREGSGGCRAAFVGGSSSSDSGCGSLLGPKLEGVLDGTHARCGVGWRGGLKEHVEV